jgi:predicted RNase H-like nuclease (RuvC/YqgF family)
MSIDICPDYGDIVSELTKENEELQARIAELEEENETLKTACDILRGDNNLLFKRLMSIETPDDLQTLKIVYVKEGSEVQE